MGGGWASLGYQEYVEGVPCGNEGACASKG